MIKILFLIPTLDRSGAEKQLTLLATRLPRDEFAVSVIVLTRSGPYEADLRKQGIPVTVLHKRLKFDPVCLWRLKNIIEAHKPDILHTWLFTANAYARLITGQEKPPHVIVSERCVDSWKSGWQLWLDKRQISRTTHLIGNSQGVVDFYRDLGYAPELTSMIHNGVACPTIEKIDRAGILKTLDIPPDAQVVGYIGRLAPQKRGEDLIWAMQLLRQMNSRVHLVVAGEGPDRKKMEQLARHFGCDHLIRFLGHREDVADLLSVIDVFWLASEFEGLSNSLMEAMAAGIPVVASDIEPNRELVVDGETGFLVRVGDSVGFAQFSDRLLADAEMLRKMGTAARERMLAHFSIEQMVESHQNLYRRIMNPDQ